MLMDNTEKVSCVRLMTENVEYRLYFHQRVIGLTEEIFIMNKDCGIYCYENKINGKKYIGQSISISYRRNRHEASFKKKLYCRSLGTSQYLWRAVKKYSRRNFDWYILECCKEQELDELEIYYIKKLNSHVSEKGYNLSLGGLSVASCGYKRKNPSSKYVGVYYRQKKTKTGVYGYWISAVRINGKAKEISHSPNETLAAMYFDEFIEKHHLPYPSNFNLKERNEIKKKYKDIVYVPKEKRTGSSSKYFGVRVKYVGKYKYFMSFIGKDHIGCFKNEIDAAKSYDNYIKENLLCRKVNFPSV